MKLTKQYGIDSAYIAIVEVDRNEVIIYIEKIKRFFFGLIDWNDRVTPFHIFTLVAGPDKERGVDIERMIHGYYGRYQLLERNIEMFDVQKEIGIIFNSFTRRIANEYAFNKKIEAAINKL